MPRQLTVVYEIHDEDSFAEEGRRLSELQQSFDPENPPSWGISAASCDNEIKRVELIEQAISERAPPDAIKEIGRILDATGNSLIN